MVGCWLVHGLAPDPSRSERFSVRRSRSSARQRAMLAVVSAQQNARAPPSPRYSRGRVYCPNSNSRSAPRKNLADCFRSSPSTPGTSRATASITTIAATSPPPRTKSPIEISSGSRICRSDRQTPRTGRRAAPAAAEWPILPRPLIEPSPVGRQHDQVARLGMRAPHMLGTLDDRLDLAAPFPGRRRRADRPPCDACRAQNHESCAARPDQSPFDRPLDQALTQVTRQHFRKQGQHVEAHGPYSAAGGRLLLRLGARFAARRPPRAAGSAAPAARPE